MNILSKPFLVMALTLLYTHTALADMEGAALKAACLSKDKTQHAICNTCLDAVIETQTLTTAALKELLNANGYTEPMPILWCAPNPHPHQATPFYDARNDTHINVDQARQVVLRDLEHHTKALHFTAAQWVIEALTAAYSPAGSDRSGPTAP